MQSQLMGSTGFRIQRNAGIAVFNRDFMPARQCVPALGVTDFLQRAVGPVDDYGQVDTTLILRNLAQNKCLVNLTCGLCLELSLYTIQSALCRKSVTPRAGTH